MSDIQWEKPSGLKIETNDMDETVDYCKSLGWKQISGKKPKDEAPVKKKPAKAKD